ncbi:MAG: PD-(D/E)XK nuclease family protein, partial [Brachymonas denitrificans]
MNPVTVSPVWQRLLQQVAQQLASCGADPSRSVVLLPYAQLLPVARQQWALLPGAGLLPRFETTSNWAARRGPFLPGPDDLTADAAQGLLTA